MNPVGPIKGMGGMGKRFPKKTVKSVDKKLSVPPPTFKDLLDKARKEREKLGMDLREFAKWAVEKENQGVPSEKAVHDFLDKHPNPTDAQFHAFTDKHKFNTHKAEAIAYRLAAKQVKFIRGGKSNDPGPKHYDPKQMKAGVEVEAEHTPDMESRKKISRDHLAEFANYYIPHLRDLEANLKGKK